jgi:GNAT superfamily N-acetyltransferase
LPLEIGRAAPGAADAFFKTTQREALKTFYDFSVVWHEQSYDFTATDRGAIAGAATIRVAASLAHVERVVVLPQVRRTGIGRALLEAAADAANYYNCHKLTALVPHRSAAQRFLEACGYHEEAVLPQHTFKLDMAVMRKFLL